ncbi:uncharacterized protein MYCFIDRAFT_169896 [Pseudocercospora fijiensis CIRAD86]|uniref:Transcription factor domain-containing protein n=1 Tax=Pseudocercospora fijiensis (strain CIRAD86) TaxID=383855 RepID=N1Q6T1_PSEFD|nr:uncharacterized protein MYCFIDRAFT_169896 [Pseudocercospora fijiensis CIRAD86]EME88240.1 hypothetical protein MYCFIDRAFT_169896 [Pseudocercospora fijiensis CIRAD86]
MNDLGSGSLAFRAMRTHILGSLLSLLLTSDEIRPPVYNKAQQIRNSSTLQLARLTTFAQVQPVKSSTWPLSLARAFYKSDPAKSLWAATAVFTSTHQFAEFGQGQWLTQVIQVVAVRHVGLPRLNAAKNSLVAAVASNHERMDRNESNDGRASPGTIPVLPTPRPWVHDAPDQLDSTWGSFDSLPAAYGREDLPYLSSAVEACAISYLAVSTGKANLDDLASQAYGKTITLFAPIVQEPKKAASDASLACMMLLSLYETISGTKPATELFHAHQGGQAAAVYLRMRHHEAEVSTWSDKSILSQTNRQLLWRDIGHRTVPKFGSSIWPENTYRSWLDEAVARITSRVTTSCGQVKELQTAFLHGDAGILATKLARCTDEALAVYSAIETCVDAAPQTWKPQIGPQHEESAFCRATPRSLSNLESQLADFSLHSQNMELSDEDVCTRAYRPRVDVYPSRAIMTLWNMMRGVQLHLIRAMMDLRSMTTENTSSALPSFADLQQKLSETVHHICGSIPYALGDVARNEVISGPSADLPALLWVLHKVCCIPGLSPEIRYWANDTYAKSARRIPA